MKSMLGYFANIKKLRILKSKPMTDHKVEDCHTIGPKNKAASATREVIITCDLCFSRQ